MAYKNKEDDLAWRRKTTRKRREEYFANKVCVDCGAGSFLELDHIDPKTKRSHRIWLWSKQRREEELAKCVVRCNACHKRRHRENGGRWRQKEKDLGSKHIQVENSGPSTHDQRNFA